MSDKNIKEELRQLLAEAFQIPKEKVVKGKTIDLIVQCGNNESDWYYFEIKSTNKDKRKNKDYYFGAASINQFIKAKKYQDHFFFIIASVSSEGNRYAIVGRDNLLSYMTGSYVNVDFNIPEGIMRDYCIDKDQFKCNCINLWHKRLFIEFPQNQYPKIDKINRFNKLEERLEKEI